MLGIQNILQYHQLLTYSLWYLLKLIALMQVIQAIALTYAVTVQLINMLTDIVLYQLNPRLRMQK